MKEHYLFNNSNYINDNEKDKKIIGKKDKDKNLFIDPTSTYHGDSDVQLERINVFFNEAI